VSRLKRFLRTPRRILLRTPRLFVRLFSPDDRELGELGEEVAARHLARRGWTILARRLRTKSGEADLVARSLDALAVVEVKTGRSNPIPRPRGADLPESVSLRWRPGARCDARRLARLRTVGREIAAAQPFRSRSGTGPILPRVDLIEVWLAEPGRRFRILHHEDLRRPLP
jgi:hypothetical protein